MSIENNAVSNKTMRNFHEKMLILHLRNIYSDRKGTSDQNKKDCNTNQGHLQKTSSQNLLCKCYNGQRIFHERLVEKINMSLFFYISF